MRPTVTDGAILFYNFAVALSGGYAAFRFGVQDRWTLFPMALVIAAVWTVYFRYGMVDRVATLADSSES